MTEPSSPADELVITPMPALCVILLNLEKAGERPLTESAVLAARDAAVCMAVPRSMRDAMDAARGYRDLDLENAWQDWLELKAWLATSVDLK